MMLARNEIVQYLRGFSVGHGGLEQLGLKFEVEAHDRGVVSVRLLYRNVPHRDTGNMPSFDEEGYSRTLFFSTLVDISSDEIAKEIRMAIHQGMRHEADEGLLWNGKRIFDPHRPTFNPNIRRP